MLEPGSSLEYRKISSFPISIGTSLALESIFDPRLQPYDSTRQIPQHIDILKYQYAYFNLWTLFRNLAGSVDKSVFLISTADELASIILSEIEVIKSLFQIEGNNVCTPIFYFCTYTKFYNTAGKYKIRLRRENSDIKNLIDSKLVSTLNVIKKSISFKLFDSDIIPEIKSNALIITHIPYDLLSYRNFNKLDLLESNTGKLKSRNQWASKYYPVAGRSTSSLPFNKKLLLVFGDKVLIHPSDIKLRRLVLDIADEKRWLPTTTMAKITQDFELNIKEPYVLDFLKSLPE